MASKLEIGEEVAFDDEVEPLVDKYALPPVRTTDPAVPKTVPQFPCALKSLTDLEFAAAVMADMPRYVTDPIVAAAATVDAVEKATPPLATIPIAVAAPVKLPPQVTTVAATQATTTTAAIAQCHHACPVESTCIMGEMLGALLPLSLYVENI